MTGSRRAMKLFSLTSTERSWARAALGALFPALPEEGLPGIADMGLDAFLDDFVAHAPGKATLGVRVGVAFVALSPPVVLQRLCTITGLSDDERDELLGRLASSRFDVARKVVFVLKATGALLYAADPQVRARMFGDAPREPASSPLPAPSLLRKRVA